MIEMVKTKKPRRQENVANMRPVKLVCLKNVHSGLTPHSHRRQPIKFPRFLCSCNDVLLFNDKCFHLATSEQMRHLIPQFIGIQFYLWTNFILKTTPGIIYVFKFMNAATVVVILNIFKPFFC